MNARIRAILGVMLGVAVLFAVFMYKDMSAETPALDDLRSEKANLLRLGYERDTLIPGGQASIEFFGDDGRRFQTPGISVEDLRRIEEALGRGVPVHIRYGSSPMHSPDIFTVYQLEIGGSVVIPYERLAKAQQNKRGQMWWAIPLFLLVAGGTIFLGAWLGMRIRRALAQGPLNSGNPR